MEHIDIEKKIKKINQSLELELKESGAVDLTGKAIDKKVFDDIIDKKIAEIKRLEYLVVDEMGVAKDRYAANIFFHQLELLNEMKRRHAVAYEPNLSQPDPALEKINKQTKHSLKTGILKLFQKIPRYNKPKEYS